MFRFQLVIRYIKYKLFSHSKKGHGIHSPFVYDFIREVLRTSKNVSLTDLNTIVQWHKSLARNSEKITISEVGAGSFKSSDNNVVVGKMVRKTSLSSKYGKLLSRLVKYYNPDSIVEFGTGMGISAAYLAWSMSESTIHTIEGDSGRFTFAEAEFKKLGLNNIHCYNQDFDAYIADQRLGMGNYFILIDGNHKKEATLRYFNYFSNICDENSIIVFDDINWSNEMQDAWRKIIKHPDVSISIDIFFMGIVFFRKGIPKQHFVVNF